MNCCPERYVLDGYCAACGSKYNPSVLSDYAKRFKYESGYYAFPAPPICHIKWGKKAWIKYIDTYGKWL